MVKVSSDSPSFGRQLSHNPAKANGSPLFSPMANGRFDLASRRCHSKKQSAGTRQRRFFSASLKAGFDAASSARALIVV
jgi:hypothetical protein